METAKQSGVLLVTRRGAMRARTKAINHLKALVVTAHEELRHQLRRHDTDELIAPCARLRTLPSHSTEHRATVIALRHTARRILTLEAEANDLETEIGQLIKAHVPWLLDEIGVGRSAPHSCSARGPTLAGCAHTPRSRRSEAPRRSPPHLGRPSATGSSVAGIASSTAPCTPSC